MPDQPTTVQVNILDKEYLVACPEEQRDELERAAKHLDRQMREIRTSGKVFGTERIAVMAALNITHELLQKSAFSSDSSDTLSRMNEKLDQVLSGN
ncbi:cell division protein ZapA [Mangrovitalea sediminis]|uniref:cell division protein ZapA n=1 Tax=Mangrovitalea sediminis TaxID=1982043 RepID=UPI000BE56C57|nr:cell division protein ZapA [Mangrovitalea sediminis]